MLLMRTGPGSGQAAALLQGTSVPPCLAEVMASTRDPCLLRIVHMGKVVFKPNPLWAERVCSEAQLN